jgi:transposase
MRRVAQVFAAEAGATLPEMMARVGVDAARRVPAAGGGRSVDGAASTHSPCPVTHVETALAELDVMIAAAMEPWSHQLELLQTIPGVGLKTAQVIIAETGGDMAEFPTAAHLAAWAGVAPAMHESAGKRRPAGSRKGNKWLASMLVEAARSVSRSKTTYLAAQYAQIASRRGRKRPLSPSRTRCWSLPTTC